MRPYWLAALAAGLLLIGPLGGQDVKPVSPDEPEHQKLRALRDDLVKAFNRRDLDTVLSFLHPDVVVTWQNGEVSRKREGVRQYYQKMLLDPNSVVEGINIEDVEVAEVSILHGKDKATSVAWGTMKDHYQLRDGMKFSLHTHWSATLVREGDRWLLAEAHLSDNLFDNDILHLAIKRTALWTGGAALVVGLIVGGGVGWLVRRRRPTPGNTPP